MSIRLSFCLIKFIELRQWRIHRSRYFTNNNLPIASSYEDKKTCYIIEDFKPSHSLRLIFFMTVFVLNVILIVLFDISMETFLFHIHYYKEI